MYNIVVFSSSSEIPVLFLTLRRKAAFIDGVFTTPPPDDYSPEFLEITAMGMSFPLSRMGCSFNEEKHGRTFLVRDELGRILRTEEICSACDPRGEYPLPRVHLSSRPPTYALFPCDRSENRRRRKEYVLCAALAATGNRVECTAPRPWRRRNAPEHGYVFRRDPVPALYRFRFMPPRRISSLSEKRNVEMQNDALEDFAFDTSPGILAVLPHFVPRSIPDEKWRTISRSWKTQRKKRRCRGDGASLKDIHKRDVYSDDASAFEEIDEA